MDTRIYQVGESVCECVYNRTDVVVESVCIHQYRWTGRMLCVYTRTDGVGECVCVCLCACLGLICSLRKVECLAGGVGEKGGLGSVKGQG